MYILASVFFLEKTINMYLKLEIRVGYMEFLAFKYIVIIFFETKQMIIYTGWKVQIGREGKKTFSTVIIKIY